MDRETEKHFHLLAELSRAERDAYYREYEVGTEARAELEDLLHFDQSSGDSLNLSVAASAEQLLRENDWDATGSRCGPYLLTRVLGRGGAGCVFLGERTDGEVEQRVAIKMLHHAQAGPTFLERFLRERQILATLNHPGIARLLDAGHAEDGRPYLVMDHVDGAPIDVYAEGLDLRAKLKLFLQLCDTVSYAHRNLVIHRDIKPSNVLVDKDGQSKLLDFGIARMIDAATNQTMTVERLLTPDYASPEQVRGTARSAASDIYSMGAVLYKLLAGRPPHTFANPGRKAIEFAICTEEPPPPSRRNANVPEDLDCIVLKALHKQPEQRYRSAEAFGDDIQAFLESAPVRARRGNAIYRARKFVRRYWMASAAVGIVVASLSAALYVTRHERVVAQRRFAELRRLAHTLVFDVHDEIAKLEGSTKSRELMVRTGLEYLDHLIRDSGDDVELQLEIAAAYMKIGDAQGYPNKPNLGRIAEAQASYQKAGDIYRRMAAKNSAYVPELASFYVKYAGLVRFTHDLKQARSLAESAIQWFDSVHAEGRRDLEDNYITAWCTLGDMDEDLGDVQRAWTEFRKCRDLARARLNTRNDARGLSMMSQASERIGTAARSLGLLTEALAALDEDEAALRQLLAAEPRNPSLHRREALAHHYRSTVYFDDQQPNLGDPARALESAKRYLATAEAMVKNDPSDSAARFSRAVAQYSVSVPLREIDPAEAVAAARASVRLFEEIAASGKTSYLTASRRVRAMQRLGESQLRAGQAKEAWRTAAAALEEERKLASRDDGGAEAEFALAPVLLLAGNAALEAGEFARAEQLLEETQSVSQVIAKRGELTSIIPLARAEESLARFYLRRGRIDEARLSYARLAELWEHCSNTSSYTDKQRAASVRLLASVRSHAEGTP